MKASHIELCSPYPPAECAARLSGVTEPELSVALFSLLGTFGGKPMLGQVTETSVRLRLRFSSGSAFQSIFEGTMQPDGDGTLITGDFAMHPHMVALGVLWVCFVFGVGGLMAAEAIIGFLAGRAMDWANTWSRAFIPVGMAVFGVLIVILGRYLARSDVRSITYRLAKTLDAHSTAHVA